MKSTTFTVSHILDTIDEPPCRQNENRPGSKSNKMDSLSSSRAPSDSVKLEIVLQDAELWRKFHSLVNEMIVTKNGR